MLKELFIWDRLRNKMNKKSFMFSLKVQQLKEEDKAIMIIIKFQSKVAKPFSLL